MSAEHNVLHERRSTVISDADIERIVDRLIERRQHIEDCRFIGITPEEVKESVLFAKNFNHAMSSSKKIIWNTILVLGVGGVFTLICVGFVMKVKELAGIH